MLGTAMDMKPNRKRSAPKPLSVYLGAAMAMLAPDAVPAERARHQESIRRMIEGIRKYQSHDFYRPERPANVVWRAGTSTLSFYPARPGVAGLGPLLLVPSMINGAEILDLLPGRSFVEFMIAGGFDVYLLDWGVPSQDDGLYHLDGGVIARLNDAAGYINEQTGVPVNALGYCMGGTLLLGAAARKPEIFHRLILLSAPWDFHAGDKRMMAQVMAGAPSALSLLEAKSTLPVDWIQTVFAHVNPRLAIDKFSNFLDMAINGEDEKIFIAVEDWLNGGQDLSAGVARSCILDWYTQNAPARGEWVSLSALSGHPVLVVAAEKDILVPPESACAVVQQIPRAAILRPVCGHISLMAGRQAEKVVWQPVLDWSKSLA